MKPRFTYHRSRAFTLVDVVVTLALFLVIGAMMLPLLTVSHCGCGHIYCVSNLKQINLALRIWEGDNNNQYPMLDSTNIHGGKEWIEAGNVAGCFQVVSNELSTPRILICPADRSHTVATNFDNDFNNSHISYFLSPDASETYPQMILDGDDNFELHGVVVKSGLFAAPSSAPIVWGPGRHGDVPVHHFWTRTPHNFVGNLGFADGSVAEESSLGLQNALQYAVNGTPFMTNRFAIP
jgi:prepilin-type processing-associated H-X9-DG protein